jgi:hypothetical protein
VLVVRLAERFIHLTIDDKGFGAAFDMFVHDFSWRRFAAVQIWIFTCFLIYVTATELSSLLGEGQLFRLFFRHRSNQHRLTRRQHVRALMELSRLAETTPREQLLNTATPQGQRLVTIVDALRRQHPARLLWPSTVAANNEISWIILGMAACSWPVAWRSGAACGMCSIPNADGDVVEIRREGVYAPVCARLASGETRRSRTLAAALRLRGRRPGDRSLHARRSRGLPASILSGCGSRRSSSGIRVPLVALRRRSLGPRARRRAAVLGEGAFAAIAVAATVLGILALWNAVGLYTDGLRAEGTVLEVRRTSRTEDETVTRSDGSEVRRQVERSSYAPVVRFTTNEGREIEFHGRGGSETSLVEGDRVTVIYDPAHPIRASSRRSSTSGSHRPRFGVAFLFGGSVWLSRWSRQRPPKSMRRLAT